MGMICTRLCPVENLSCKFGIVLLVTQTEYIQATLVLFEIGSSHEAIFLSTKITAYKKLTIIHKKKPIAIGLSNHKQEKLIHIFTICTFYMVLCNTILIFKNNKKIKSYSCKWLLLYGRSVRVSH